MIARTFATRKPLPFSSPTPWRPPPARPFAAPALGPFQPRPAQPMNLAAAHPLAALSNRGPAANQGDAPRPVAPASALAPSASKRTQTPEQHSAPERPTRQALARYDGPHSLSIRSAASGRHYRFEQKGQTLVIDAMDIALMRRIEDVTLL